MEENSQQKSRKVDWLKIIKIACIALCVAGIVMIPFSHSNKEYSAEEFCLAQDSSYVYEKSSGKIVHYIEKNESLKLTENTIIITKTNRTLKTMGWIIAIFFGLSAIGIFCEERLVEVKK